MFLPGRIVLKRGGDIFVGGKKNSAANRGWNQPVGIRHAGVPRTGPEPELIGRGIFQQTNRPAAA